MLCRLVSAGFVSCVLLVSGCASSTSEQKAAVNEKDIAVTVLQKLGTTDPNYLNYIREDYIQHNLGAATGKQGLINFLKQFPSTPAKDSKSYAVRVLQDGNYVIVQSNVVPYDSVVFDIFRFKNGKIAEHWDNAQSIEKQPNPSGHTQTDGSTKIVDRDKTLQNKVLVRNFVQTVLVDNKIDETPKFISSTQYIQHNPHIADGMAGLRKAFANMAKQGQLSHYRKIEAVLGEGNFVLVVSSGQDKGKPIALYDLFRVANNKIVEHWDVVAPIPPKAQQKNDNGKFNFPDSVMK
ncbi:SnoaL-like domain protein [Marinomonas spartinae]|uniref:SnoaL-like domain protein n=1 Tax=Marinomonas spartinae TaxID=1792290 RepID=A0A1A8T2C0_9GAMM|nr:nuclear transport factor 2 family protein [Marinomonas spartinae]SBS26184.1 SnoaL-like domain protein [Marinomonas spartinae]SBS40016.1 SnoaL-like domain protein [Marinomonas spartinae]